MTGLVDSVRQQGSNFDDTFTYTYDANGNILSVSDGTYTTSYVYDSANQLLRENNQKAGYTYTWEYDNAGNILTRNEYSYTTGSLENITPQDTINYTYGDQTWGDLLTAYDGQAITYDEIGNPLTDGTWTYTWAHGRELSSMSKTGTTWNFTYDENGYRTKRTNGTKTYDYAYVDGLLRYMEIDGTPYYFTYAPDGTPMGIVENDTPYFYELNLQGDIVGITSYTGYRVVQYTYDAWGNILSCTGSRANTIGKRNPLRYRGYAYDEETGLYYLISRYYSAETGRFLNADDIEYLGANASLVSYHLFAYCNNNPITGYDPTGTFNWNIFLKGISIALVGITAIASVCTAGCAAPALAAAIAIASGIACISFGAAEVTESITNYNVIRDGLMGGNEQLYNTTRKATELTASLSTIAVNVGAAINKAANPNMVCFIEGTLVATKNGLVSIEEIQVGDLVWATDEKTGEAAFKKVVQLFRNQTEEWIHVKVNGEVITCTPQHPFYSPVKGWTSAIDLRAGDILVMLNGEYVIVEQVQHELLESPEITYNFEVEDFHTYYVGGTKVLAHNMCAKKSDIKQIESVAKKLKMDSVQRRGFGDYIEYLKRETRNDFNFSYADLICIGKEFLEGK